MVKLFERENFQAQIIKAIKDHEVWRNLIEISRELGITRAAFYSGANAMEARSKMRSGR